MLQTLFALTVLLLSLHPEEVMLLKYCFEGTYEIVREDGYVTCVLCPEGSYMTKYDHRERSCYICTKPDPEKKEVEYTKCNRTHDTTFKCADGYYRDPPRNPRETGRCVRCTDCKAQGLYLGRTCQTFSDSICCANENFDVAENGDGHPMCREKPWMCGPGHYLIHKSFKCIPCPVGTFMYLEYHSVTECWKCPSMADYYIPLNTVIDQECNSTHPATYRCKDGYTRNKNMGHKHDSTGCVPCTECENFGLNCTPEVDTLCCPQPNMKVIHAPGGDNVCCPSPNITITSGGDAVCCPRPSMIAVDGPKTPECHDPPTTVAPEELRCGVNQYLHIDCDNEKIACKPCPEGTFMNETNHVDTSCQRREIVNKHVETVGNAWIIAIVVICVLLMASIFINIIFCFHKTRTCERQLHIKQINPCLEAGL